jgi:hypothetical protein
MGKCEERLATFAVRVALYVNNLQEYRRTRWSAVMEEARKYYTMADLDRRDLERSGCISKEISEAIFKHLQEF